MGDTARLEPVRHLSGLRRRFLAQPVLNGERRNSALALARPGGSEQAKRQAIGAA